MSLKGLNHQNDEEAGVALAVTFFAIFIVGLIGGAAGVLWYFS